MLNWISCLVVLLQDLKSYMNGGEKQFFGGGFEVDS